MRKNLITSAIVLGSLSSQAGSITFINKKFPLELTDGKQIEIVLQQEVPDEDLPLHTLNLQDRLSLQVISNEKMLQILNNISRAEEEVKEDLIF
jgi:hypothetical protein